MVKGLNPELFIKEFEPGSNPFEVSIIRLINPKGIDVRGSEKSILVKLLSRIKMRAFSDAHRRAFENLVKAIDVKEQFCGLFTPDVSEIYFDGDVMIVDLTSYLKPGMETKIGKLFQVATESPKVHEERIPNREVADRAITNHFLRNVGTGMSIADALRLAIQQQEAGMTDAPPKPVIAPPLPPPPPPPPPVIQRTPKVEPPIVKVSPDPVDTVIDDKIADMERVAREKEAAEAKEEAAKSKGKRKSVRLKRRKKGGEEEEGQEMSAAPEVEEPRPDVQTTQDVAPAPEEQKPVETTHVVPPLPQVSKEPEIEIRTATTGAAEEKKQLGSLLSRLKGIDLDAPKDLPKEAPKVSEELRAIPPPPKEEPKPEPPPPPIEEPRPAPPKEDEKPSVNIPPPPSFGEMDKGDAPEKPKAKEPEKPKSGESGLDELMKKLRSHSLK